MKYFIFLLLIVSTIKASAAYEWGFGNISINYLNWDNGTEDKSTKEDFFYAELEGGAQFSWGELYGFFDLENFDKRSSETRSASKSSINYNLGLGKLSLYAHQYSFNSLGFAEQNRVVGFGYSFSGDGWFFKPFLGFHDVIQTFYTGPNGYMGGWVLGYNFKLWTESFMLVDWHEIEFARNAKYALGNGDSKTGHNGAASVWWNIKPSFSIGQQWRYAIDKLGTDRKMNAAITTLKYNF